MTSNIFPVLRYADARGAIEWLVRVFGFERQFEYPGTDGSIAHAELRIGAGVIGISSAGPRDEANPWTRVRRGVYVAMGDVDAHYARAQGAGVEIAKALETTSYGSREYSARDCGAHLWSFGTYPMGAREGEPNVFPELQYDTPDAVAWLGRSFGFEPTAQIPGPDGPIVHAEMRLGDGTILMSLNGGDGFGESRQGTSVRLDDPDAHHATAKAAGATIVMAPMTTRYGARMYWARDQEGFLWGFSTYQPGR